jgi:hypothetical protein
VNVLHSWAGLAMAGALLSVALNWALVQGSFGEVLRKATLDRLDQHGIPLRAAIVTAAIIGAILPPLSLAALLMIIWRQIIAKQICANGNARKWTWDDARWPSGSSSLSRTGKKTTSWL